MITQKSNIQVTSTLTGPQVNLSLDENSAAHLMGLFIDLYSDQEAAVIREYSTNARDSHVEAGIDRPIEITLPSAWEPTLRIKDYGIGMSEHDIVETYSKYGASTKRDSDEFNGCLGLGCKSALTYTNQFTVVGVKYGVKTTVAISREDNGGGSMQIVDQSPTDEPSGVEIVIPVEASNSFKSKAADLFRFWDEGTVLVNGEMPARIQGKMIEDDLMVAQGLYGQDYVVMGGVGYPADLKAGLKRDASLVAFVEIGSVNFTPSREALQYTQITKDAIATITEVFRSRIVNVIRDEVEATATPGAALRVLMDWKNVVDNRSHQIDISYKGATIPEFITGRFIMTTADSRKLSTHNTVNQIATDYVSNALFIHGYTNNFTGAHKKKLNKYREDNGITQEIYLLAEDKIDSQWMEGATWVDWADIKVIKLPNNRTYSPRLGNNKPTGSYKEAYVNGVLAFMLTADKIDTAKPIFYSTNMTLNDRASKLIHAHKPGGFTLVLLTPNRVNKFKRDFPTAREPQEFLAKTHRRIATKITREDMLVKIVKGCYESDVYAALDASKIDDPAIKEAIELCAVKESAKMDEWDAFRGIRHIIGTTDLMLDTPDWDSPLTNYPLAPRDAYTFRRDGKKLDHIYLYLNAAFTAQENN